MRIERFLLTSMVAMTVCIAGYAQTPGKILVAYYSATGTTEEVAKEVASISGGTLYEIKPEQEYSSADLNWNNSSSRSSREMADAKSRPAIVKDLVDAASFDTVYIGFPIWWDEAPRVVNSFIEAYGFDGKTVILFATSGGSSIANSEKVLRQTYPNLKWKSGKLLNRRNVSTLFE